MMGIAFLFVRMSGTFLRNHAPHIAAMDLFVVPTLSGFSMAWGFCETIGSGFSQGCGCYRARIRG